MTIIYVCEKSFRYTNKTFKCYLRINSWPLGMFSDYVSPIMNQLAGISFSLLPVQNTSP